MALFTFHFFLGRSLEDELGKKEASLWVTPGAERLSEIMSGD
jgi:hypothetical protein